MTTFRSFVAIGALILATAEVQGQSQPARSNPFLGATPQPGQAGSMDLGFLEAIDRGLKYNIGLLISNKTSEQSRAARLEQLSKLLPAVDGTLRGSRQKTNLEAFGFKLPGVPRTVEVSNSDIRASVSAPLIDLHALSNERAAAQSANAAQWDARDARETVTLAVATTYLQTVTAEASLTSARADFDAARALFQLASDRERAGVSPNIDTLRAQVEMQSRQQAVTQAQNALDKQRIALLRIVGLPLGQPVVLTSRVPYKTIPDLGPDEAFKRAVDTRADYKAAEANVRAAELSKRAAQVQRLPTLSFTGDFGALGTEPSNALSTWSAAGVVRLPIFEGGRIHADVLRSSAQLDQRRAELNDLRTTIEQEVNNASLDLRAAAEQVEVARVTVDFARQALVQAQDRFAAGVTNNIEVIQAQEALVRANNEFIDALHAHNIAKVMLMRAIGAAEGTLKDVLATDAATPGGE